MEEGTFDMPAVAMSELRFLRTAPAADFQPGLWRTSLSPCNMETDPSPVSRTSGLG
jgi:hypothetical protein